MTQTLHLRRTSRQLFSKCHNWLPDLQSFPRTVAKCRIRRNRELSNIIRKSLDVEARKLMLSERRDLYYIIDTTGLPDYDGSSHEVEADDL